MNEEMTLIIFRMVVAICVALVTTYVLPYLKTLQNDTRYSTVIDMISLAVRAAEQTITGDKAGNLKKAKVTAFATDWLNKQGIKITDEELSDLIESAVYQMNTEKEV